MEYSVASKDEGLIKLETKHLCKYRGKAAVSKHRIEHRDVYQNGLPPTSHHVARRADVKGQSSILSLQSLGCW